MLLLDIQDGKQRGLGRQGGREVGVLEEGKLSRSWPCS